MLTRNLMAACLFSLASAALATAGSPDSGWVLPPVENQPYATPGAYRANEPPRREQPPRGEAEMADSPPDPNGARSPSREHYPFFKGFGEAPPNAEVDNTADEMDDREHGLRPLPPRYDARGDVSPSTHISAEPAHVASAFAPNLHPLPPTGSISESRFLPRDGQLSPLVTAAGSLGIVLGLFLLVAWTMRRSMPRQVALLPREAVEVLGRAPLVGRHQVHLVRCGNKVLLVSITPGNVETLTEITDPLEIDRLAGLCQQGHPASASASFQQMFNQMNAPQRGQKFRGRRDEPEFDQYELDAPRSREFRA